MQFDILTIFPNIFNSYFSESIIKRAQKKGLIKIKIHNLRDYTIDKHKTVDDKPYGGGPGMVMKIEPIWRCLHANLDANYLRIKNVNKRKSKAALSVSSQELRHCIGGRRIQTQKSKIVLLTPRGRLFNQKIAVKWSKMDQLILICGHYEGIDERVNRLVDEKISIGPYILTSGELPAMIIVDAVSRLIPGVLGNIKSLKFQIPIRQLADKFQIPNTEFPQYTRPEIFSPDGKTKWRVPKVLLSGNHKKIQEWREKHIEKPKK